MGNFTNTVYGAEVGFAIWGMFTLLVGKTGPIRRGRARILGLLALLPFPTSCAIGFLCGIALVLAGIRQVSKEMKFGLHLMEGTVLIVYIFFIFVFYKRWKQEALREQLSPLTGNEDS